MTSRKVSNRQASRIRVGNKKGRREERVRIENLDAAVFKNFPVHGPAVPPAEIDAGHLGDEGERSEGYEPDFDDFLQFGHVSLIIDNLSARLFHLYYFFRRAFCKEKASQII
jgi:hypothetical protein